MKKAILQALEKKYEAQIAEADATIRIYLENSVGIGEHPQHIEECDKLIGKIAVGEHPQHIEECDKLIGKIAEAEDKLQILKEFE